MYPVFTNSYYNEFLGQAHYSEYNPKRNQSNVKIFDEETGELIEPYDVVAEGIKLVGKELVEVL